MPAPARTTTALLQALLIWRGLVALGAWGLAGVLLVGAVASDLALGLRVLAGVMLVILGIGSGAAMPFIVRREQRGRLLSLAVDYLGLLAGLIGLLQVTGVFLALDALAENF